MSQETDIHGMSMNVGEIKGQLRELVHSLNNLVTKFDQLAREVATNSVLPHEVETLKDRVGRLETDKSERDGAQGAWSWLVKNLPNLATILMVLFAFVVLAMKAAGKI